MSAIDDAVVTGDGSNVPSTVQKIDLDSKNKMVVSSQRDICILCENNHAQSAFQKIECVRCVKAISMCADELLWKDE